MLIQLQASGAPVTVDEAKQHLRVIGDEDNAYISGLIEAAREYVQMVASRTLTTTTWRLMLDRWPSAGYIQLPRPPVQSIAQVIYIDYTYTPVIWPSDQYVLDTDTARLWLAAGASWPGATLWTKDAIRIDYVAGQDAADVPAHYKQAMLLLIGHWYENREAVTLSGAVPKQVALAVDTLLLTDRWYADR